MRTLLLLLLPIFLFGAKAFVELDIDKAQEFFVSKKFIATLKVKTTAFSISDLDVNLEGNSDFVIISPSSAAYTNSEEIGDEQYQSSVYEYELYPLKSGGLSLKPLKVSFSVSSGYGQPKEHFNLKTSQKEIFVSSPKGVDGFILATPKLSTKTRYSSYKKYYKVGDAIAQTIDTTALDVPDVLIPKIAFADVEGFKRYEDESKLTQEKKDEGLVSKRVQSVTYVFMQEGNYTIPRQKIRWYNTQTSRITTETTMAYSFEVIDERQKEVIVVEESISYKKPLLLALVSIVFTLLFIYGIIRFRRRKNKNRYALKKRINPIE